MSNVQIACVGAGLLMIGFYLNARKGLQTGQARPGYFFDGYGYVPNNGSYTYR